MHHPRLKTNKPLFFGRDAEPLRLTDIHPRLSDNNGSSSAMIEPFSWERAGERGVNLFFLATPHEQSRHWVPEALARGMRVIDLSGAWRLKEDANRAVYGFQDADAERAMQTQKLSVYGLPELHREEIREADLVANPGCYATSIILALKPLAGAGWIDVRRGVICDSKSGVSGAGKTPTPTTHFMHAADNLSAYGLFGHRHLGEMLEQLEIAEKDMIFTPHLLPIPRGILSTIYVTLNEKRQTADVEALFRDFYAQSPMVRIFAGHGGSNGKAASSLPQIQDSVRTNYCDIGFRVAPDGKRCILVSCLDNLLKGAAGQAVENMNLMCGWNEAEGLE
jgi:N-acetyl-gamma-glutamyl-phosphate reductase